MFSKHKRIAAYRNVRSGLRLRASVILRIGRSHRYVTAGLLGVLAVVAGASVGAIQSGLTTSQDNLTTLTSGTSETRISSGGQIITTSPSAPQSTQERATEPVRSSAQTTQSGQPPADSRAAASGTTPVATPSAQPRPTPGMTPTVQQQQYDASKAEQKFTVSFNRSADYTSAVKSVRATAPRGEVTCDIATRNGDVYELVCARPKPTPEESAEYGTLTVFISTESGDSYTATTTYRLPLPTN